MISILATIDGSPESVSIIPALAKLAGDLRARVTLLTIVERPHATATHAELVSPFRGAGGASTTGVPVTGGQARQSRWSETDEQALSRAVAEGHDLLESTARELRDRGLEVETEVRVDGDVGKAIADLAKERQFDLIAMATHGRGGLSELVQGSVAAAVLRSGVAPVILVRPAGSRRPARGRG